MQAAVLSCEYLISPATAEKSILLEQIEGLIELNNLIVENLLSPLLEDQLLEKLTKRGSYPADGMFKNNLSQCGIEQYTPKDIARTISSIISRSVSFESVTSERALEWSDKEFYPLFLDIESDRQTELHSLLEGVAAANRIEECNFSLLFYCIVNKLSAISLQGTVTCAYPEIEFGLPFDFNQSISIYENYKQYLSMLDHNAIFDRATNANDLKFSIYVGVLRKFREKCIPLSEISYHQIFIGNYFWESLKNNQCLPGHCFSASALNAVVDILASYKINRPDIFETSAGSGRARMKGNCSAHRVHVTKSGVALRLMLWIDDEENIELANVGPKHELKIYDPCYI